MLISSPTAGAPQAAAAALDRPTRAASADAPDADGAPTADASPDVVVTISGSRPPASTYDATGRLPGGPSLSELGANGATSLAQATETLSTGDDAGPADAPAPDDPSAA